MTCKKEKEKEKEAEPKGTPKTLMPFKWQQKPKGGENPRGKPKGDQTKHLQG